VDISFGPEYDAFREEVRVFLAANWSESEPVRDAGDDLSFLSWSRFKEFAPKAIAAGYYGRSIPKKYGGSEQPFDPFRQLVIAQEFARIGLPPSSPGLGPRLLVPTLLAVGEEWQKERFIARTLTGEDIWCQGYSEPDAGSDLASLRTRAVLDGDQWVINGQKIWTSSAEVATHMFCLCRTDPDASKHKGISYLLFEMDQPGVEVRPLKQITGASEFNEVFLTDVRTPADWIVGEPGNGWRVANTTLLHERSGMGGAEGRFLALHAGLVEIARRVELNGRPAIEDPDIRRRLARAEARILAEQFSEYRMMQAVAEGKPPGILFLMAKLAVTDVLHELSGLYLELAGDGALLEPELYPYGTVPTTLGGWNTLAVGSLGFAIAAGTSNIQRSVIAERGFGLPRDLARQKAR
jgi:alkylation response protein AidB-like acyl-CoA dehydrogenase